MRLGVIGINHKLADLRLRDMLAKACQRRFTAGSCTHGDHSVILLSTCNRTEVYFSSDDLAATHTYLLSILRADVDQDFDQKLYSYFGEDCFFHLARVTAGLDSAILGETEIQGQVRCAYEAALPYQQLPSEMHFLFQKVLKIGKQIRSQIPMGRGMPDLEHAVLATGLQLLPQPYNARVLFVGASEINKKILCHLVRKGFRDLTLCNRSHVPAKALANRYGIGMIPWNQLNDWKSFDWVICGTKAQEYILPDVETLTGRKLVVDLSVPRNVDPNLGQHPNVTLLNIDQINLGLSDRKKHLSDLVASAEKSVWLSTQRHMISFKQRTQMREQLFAI